MDSVKQSSNKSRLARTFAKVLHIRAATGADKFQKSRSKTWEKVKPDKTINESHNQRVIFHKEDEKLKERAVMDAFIAKLFATISSVKAAYAELHQSKLKESEIIFLKEKLEEIRRENKIMEKRLNSSGSFSSSTHEKWNFSSLSLTNFLFVLKQTTKSIRSLVKFMISEMEAANWDLDAAANSIQPDVVYWDASHICYAFESFVCKQMFDGFNLPGYSIPGDSQSKGKPQSFFFDRFMELKSLKPREYITWKSTSVFAEFCRGKYLELVHPKMEASLFGNLSQRNLVNARKFPETAFFDSFLEVAKWVWLLHCLAFSFSPDGATIFQVTKGSQFSEVFMDSVNEVTFMSPESSPEVAFMVVPGFKVSKTVIQCQVYLI
ncbi:hypothetical protein E3N88_27582 [Mikania micrantha]|uniref:GIL1/IRKI C-terminal domain-containing protein n=1 Tax=Mikania micrantha TaxID=192012 RepID=A0A5N6MXN9_9ASTR|nr:hypothetical protein E3N88_27582 [Mikania micrantha]